VEDLKYAYDNFSEDEEDPEKELSEDENIY
jgi:hypothetical protein